MQYIFDNRGRIVKKLMSKEVLKEHYKSLLSAYDDRVKTRMKAPVAFPHTTG